MVNVPRVKQALDSMELYKEHLERLDKLDALVLTPKDARDDDIGPDSYELTGIRVPSDHPMFPELRDMYLNYYRAQIAKLEELLLDLGIRLIPESPPKLGD